MASTSDIPTTPPPTQPSQQSEHSTPLSAGSNTNTTYDSRPKQRDYAPFLHQDLQHEQHISFEEFCKVVLDFDTSSVPSSGGNDKAFEKLRTDYCSPVSHETHRYQPFYKLANYVLDKGGSQYVVFRNDPTCFWGIYAQRKPDELLALKSSLSTPGAREMSVDLLSASGPSESPFHPVEAVSFIEFKIKHYDLTDFKARATKATIYTPPPKPNQPSKAKRKADSEADASDSLATPATDQPRARKSPRLNAKSNTGRIKPKFMKPMPGPPATNEPEDHPLRQCASYALEMLSQGLRQHVIGFLITDAQVELLYYDRSILLRSHPLNFIDRWTLFDATLTHMGRMPLSHWGYHPLLPGMEPKPFLARLMKPREAVLAPVENIFDGVTLTLRDKSQLELGDIIHQTHGLRGRGTLVVRAKYKDGSGNVVVKISWPSSSRMSESEILAKIEEKIGATQDKWVKDHLPKILHSEDHVDSTGIQGRLAEHFGDEYEKRTLRLIVYEELEPISKLKDALQLGKAFADTVKCHRWVFERAGILHRDISLSNLMFRKTANGEICGVLNDFDLATATSQLGDGPMSKQRTGTRPFMAVDLLKKTPPPPHKYRYDLESFLYALCFLVGDPSQLSVQEWSVRGTLGLVDAKIALFVKSPDEFVLPEYQGMSTCIATVQDAFYPIYRPGRFGSSKVDVDSIVPIIAEAFVNLPDDLS